MQKYPTQCTSSKSLYYVVHDYVTEIYTNILTCNSEIIWSVQVRRIVLRDSYKLGDCKE